MNEFEKFVSEHPATLIASLILGIFLCSLVAYGIHVGVVVLGSLLMAVLVFYCLHKYGGMTL